MHTAYSLECTTSEGRAEMWEQLYMAAFPSAARYIHNRGGSFDDAKDLFHDALVIYYEKRVSGRLVIEQNDTVYITGIVKHLWHKEKKRRQAILAAHTQQDEEDQQDTSARKLLALVETAGKKCLEILKAFYYDKMKPQQVADAFGFSGTRSATVQKYKCLEKLRDTVKEKSLGYADFTE